MITIPTNIAGAFLISQALHSDTRGTYQCLFRKRDFQVNGLKCDFVEQGRAFNLHEGTLRGLHYQTKPCAQAKLVRCTAGALIDILVDLRPTSETYLEHALIYLVSTNYHSLYVPEGVAHGYLTLTDNTEVEYLMTGPYCQEHARGVRWDDPAFKIKLKRPVRIIHPRDENFKDYVKENG